RPHEAEAALATLEAFARFERDDRILRSDVAAGDMMKAIRFDLSQASGEAGGDFAAFIRALEHWIQIDQRAFDDAIHAGDTAVAARQLSWVPGLVVASLSLLGAWPRLREFG